MPSGLCCCCCCFGSTKVSPEAEIVGIENPSYNSRRQLYQQQTDDGYSSTGTESLQNNSLFLTNQVTSEQQKSAKVIEVTTEQPKVMSVGVTQLHAAAVNGDKSLLIKLMQLNGHLIEAVDRFARTPLFFAILGERMECAELLLKEGSQVNHKDSFDRTPLHWAAHKGNFNLVKLLLSKGADPRSIDGEGQLPLHLATKHKSSKCLNILIKQLKPGEVDQTDNKGRTALHIASSYGHAENVRLLLEQGFNISRQDEFGKSPIHYIAGCKSAEAVQCVNMILAESESGMNWYDLHGQTPLIQAVAEGNLDVVKAFTSSKECKVDQPDNLFRTALHWAAALGHNDIVSTLLEVKKQSMQGDVQKKACVTDGNEATPLHYAAQNNFVETVELFLKNGIPDRPDRDGRTAFMWAAGRGANDVMETFLKYQEAGLKDTDGSYKEQSEETTSSSILTKDNNGATALHAAAAAGQLSTVSLLLSRTDLMDSADSRRQTPLFYACERGHLEVVKELLKNKCVVKMIDEDGRTPLHWAALEGHANICLILIKSGLDPNITDGSGRTALQCAAYGGYVNCMSILLEKRADADIPDHEGMTAFHWACSKGHLDAVKLLMEVNATFNVMELTPDRYTPLDYALMGEYNDIVQYLIDHGALSITGIQDIAASKIQAWVRANRYRRTELPRDRLIREHERRLRNPQKKKAETKMVHPSIQDTAMEAPSPVFAVNQQGTPSGYSSNQSSPKRVDQGHRSTDVAAMDRLTDSGIGSSRSDEAINDSDTTQDKIITIPIDNTFNRTRLFNISDSNSYDSNSSAGSENNNHTNHLSQETRRQSKTIESNQHIYQEDNHQNHQQDSYKENHLDKASNSELSKKQAIQLITIEERKRKLAIKVKHRAARIIQMTWKRYKRRESFNKQQKNISDEDWQREIAALTIQLAWRKYYKQKLLKSLTPKNKKILELWDPEVIAARQKAFVQQTYGNSLTLTDFWRPILKGKSRPTWFKYIPSPAALSYNFAVDQYTTPRMNSIKQPTHYSYSTSGPQYDDSSMLYESEPSFTSSRNSSIKSIDKISDKALDAQHFSYNLNN